MRMVVTLGHLVGRIERLEIRCTRCDRTGRMRLGKLITAYGTDMDLPRLGTVFAADCPHANALRPADWCFVIFPRLADLPSSARGSRPAGSGATLPTYKRSP